MSVFVLDDKQKEKLSKLTVEQVALRENVAKELINTWKVLRGQNASESFQYEYDELLDEEDKVCEISLQEFKETAPTIYDRIGGTEGSKIHVAIKTGKYTVGLTKEVNVKNKIEEIKKNSRLSPSKREKQIKERETMFKEGQELAKKKVNLTKNLAWKIWFIEEGLRCEKFISEEKFPKNKAKVEFLGDDFIKSVRKALYGDGDD